MPQTFDQYARITHVEHEVRALRRKVEEQANEIEFLRSQLAEVRSGGRTTSVGVPVSEVQG